MATRTRRRRLTDEERAERRAQQRQLLDNAVRELLTGDSHADLIEPLQALAGELGYRVERRDLSGKSAGGWCDRQSKLIAVGIDEANAEVRTLIHELAHGLVGEVDERFAYDYEE